MTTENRYILKVATKYTNSQGEERTKYAEVGTVWENTKRDTGEKVLNINLDFPVGATELVAFRPPQKQD